MPCLFYFKTPGRCLVGVLTYFAVGYKLPRAGYVKVAPHFLNLIFSINFTPLFCIHIENF